MSPLTHSISTPSASFAFVADVVPPEPRSAPDWLAWLAAGATIALTGVVILAFRARARQRLELAAHRASIEDLRAAKERAERVAASRSSILATMSHELRTPVTAIAGFTELLRDPTSDERARRSHAEIIHRNVQHLLMVLNDTLDLSRIEAGTLRVDDEPCDMREVVHEIVELFRPQAREKGIRFEWRADADVPELVRTDPRRLRQILMNVVANAVKFTREGGVQVVIRKVEARREMVIEVADTGLGIENDVVDAIFTPYRRAKSAAAPAFDGAGLGLAISRRLAQALGGEITVDSRPGLGSTFRVSLPLVLPRNGDRESAGEEALARRAPRLGARDSADRVVG